MEEGKKKYGNYEWVTKCLNWCWNYRYAVTGMVAAVVAMWFWRFWLHFNETDVLLPDNWYKEFVEDNVGINILIFVYTIFIAVLWTYKLPHDHHELIAMIAPRAVIALGNPGYEWLGDESGYKSMMAATEVWKAMGIEDRIGFDFTGGHEHCQAASNQTKSVTAFVDKFLRDKDANTDIHVKPTNGKGFKIDNYGDWIDWETPNLPYSASSPDTSKKDSVVKGDSTTYCGDMRLAMPNIGVRMIQGRLEVSGVPAEARVKLYDVNGMLVGKLGATGGNLPERAKGRIIIVIENSVGMRLVTKVINNVGF